MKIGLYSLFLLVSITSAGFAKQGYDKDKTISKNFQVSESDLLNIDNQYGQVHVNTWEKNEIVVEVRINASHRSASRAQDLLDKVNISDHRIGNQIYLKTTIDGYGFSFTTREMLCINYLIYMPSKNALVLKNKFGDVYLSKHTGSVEMNVSYGNVRIDELKGADKFVKVSFGSLSIVSIEQGRIDVSYSKLSIDKAGTIEVNNTFGKSDIDQVLNLKLTQKYGSVELAKVSKLSGSVEFASIELDEIGKSIDLNLRYCTNVDIRRIAADFEWIKIDAGFSNLNFKIHEQNIFQFDMQLKHGEFRNGSLLTPLEMVKSSDQNNIRKSYKGKFGKTGQALIYLKIDYGSVNFR